MKVNKTPEIISVCFVLYLQKISVRKPHFDISHIQLFCFQINLSYKENENLKEVFHVKSPFRFSIFATRKL